MLKKHTILLNNQQATYYWIHRSPNESRPIAHFYTGNGFTTGVYQPLLEQLATKFDVVSLAMPGAWDTPPSTKRPLTREQDRDLLIAFLGSITDQPVIGIGHSQGATATAMAAAQCPELFSRLYLIEPVTFTAKQKYLADLIPAWIKRRKEPFKSTLAKPASWDSVDSYYEFLRGHRAYRRISDDHLRIFAAQSLRPLRNGRCQLICSPQHEYASYLGTPYIDPALKQLNRLDIDYQILLGKPTMFVSQAVRQHWQKLVPADRLHVNDEVGHLYPLEAPDLCAELILAHHNHTS